MFSQYSYWGELLFQAVKEGRVMQQHFLRDDAVCGSHHPLTVDQGSSTDVSAVVVDTDLPGPVTHRGISAAHYTRI